MLTQIITDITGVTPPLISLIISCCLAVALATEIESEEHGTRNLEGEISRTMYTRWRGCRDRAVTQFHASAPCVHRVFRSETR